MNKSPQEVALSAADSSKQDSTDRLAIDIKALVKQLFEAEDIDEINLPEALANVDAVTFVKELALYRQEAKRAKTIEISAYSDASNANALLKILEQAQPEVSDKVMQEAVAALQISLDCSVDGSNAFVPKLLPNGAVLIRHDHCVAAIDESPSLRLSVPHTELRAELAKVLQNNPQADDDDAVPQFAIIHRQPDSRFVYTRKLPEQLSDWGQSLVFIGSDLDLSASDFLSDTDLRLVCEDSCTGTVILRVFADFTLVHGTSRASDEFDTIAEEYDAHSFYQLDNPEGVKVSQDLDWVKSFIVSRTEERIENSDLERPRSGVMRDYFDHIMLSSDNHLSYARRKAGQVNQFTPFFHESPHQPVHYEEAQDPYWRLSEQFGHKLVVVELLMQVFSDIDDFQHNFQRAIQIRLFEEVGFPAHQMLLLTKDVNVYQGKECAHALDSEAAKRWIDEHAYEMRAELNEATECYPNVDQDRTISEILSNSDVRVRVALVFEAKPDYVELDGLMKRLSAQLDASANLSVPCVGFCQSYDSGEYDNGNAQVLLTQVELKGDAYDGDEE